MPIDPNIPLSAVNPNGLGLAQMAREAQERRYREAQMAEFERKNTAETERRGALSDLIATRGPNGFDTKGPAFQRYSKADPEGAFKMLDALDTERRKQVTEGVKDLANAVQWADTPDKWAIVQRHYGQYDPQLAQTPFEQREQSLIALGQMGEYLKSTEPKIITPQPGGGAFSYSRQGGLQTVIAPNDGSQPMGAPVTAPAPSGGIREGSTATNPQTGQKIIYQGGQWVPMAGGQTARPSGTFRPVGLPGETVTSTRRSVAHNKRVGGKSNSYHLSGRARDSVPPQGMTMAEYHRRLSALNPHLDVINEGDHVHMEPR